MKDSTKLFIVCMLLAFLVGMWTAVVMNMGRNTNDGCSVTYKHGDRVHVLIGKRD